MMSLGEKQFGVAKSATSSSTRPRNGRAFALQIVLVKIGSDVTGTARERSCVESVSQSDSCHLAGTRNHHPRRKTMIYKRGKVYWYKFQFNGTLVRESTRQGNDKVARQMEAAHRTSLAKGEVGIRDKKKAPTFGEFAEKQFLPWAESTFSAKHKTWLYYRNGVRRLKGYASLSSMSLDDAKLGEKVSGYVAHRQAKGLQVASINRELQVLRRLLH